MSAKRVPTFISSVYPRISRANKVVGWNIKLDSFRRTMLLFFSYWWIAILKVALKTRAMSSGWRQYVLVCVGLRNILHSQRIWKKCLGFMCFYQGTTQFYGYFFNVFYLYTLCTFYYPCKLCLYDFFFCSSVFLGVDELAFMLHLLFIRMSLIFGSESNLQYQYFPPVKFTLAL